MIFLKKDIDNIAIFTLLEKESVYSGEYSLTITNPQDHSVISGIYLYDISTNPDRYQEFNIALEDSDIVNGYTYDIETFTTIIYNLISGYYDYEVFDYDGESLEIGRLRVDTVVDVVNETYTPTVEEYIYKK